MSEALQLSVSRTEDGRWRVRHSVNVPAHAPLSGQHSDILTKECGAACILPVHAHVERNAISGQVTALTLWAVLPSEEESRSTETEQAFARSAANVAEVLRRRLTAG